MRISDWSSDVCASDLPSFPTQPSPRLTPPANAMTAHCSLRPESETKRPCNPGDEGRGGRPEGDGTGADAMSSGCATGPGSVAVSLPPNAPSPRSRSEEHTSEPSH